MSSLLQRRLPGVRFDVPAPALDEALPRMDIAFFVGFSACGPLGVPVAVESLAEFEDVFGAEITLLARPDGSPLRGLLHPALRQFFSHGGRRAWVQRVAAAHARTTIFALQQMLLLRRPDATSPWRVEPAWISARCPGSWADSLSVFARCEALPLVVMPVQFDGQSLTVTALGPLSLALAVGDTLKIALDADDWVQGRVIEAATADTAGTERSTGRLQRSLRLAGLASLRGSLQQATPTRVGWTVPVLRGDGTAEQHAAATGTWNHEQLTLDCLLPARARLEVGELVRVSFAAGRPPAWMALDDVQSTALGDEQGRVQVQLKGRPWRVPGSLASAPLQAWVARAEEGTALWLRAGVGAAFPALAQARLDGLALVPRPDGAPSLFGLPDDIRHYTERGRQAALAPASQTFEATRRDSQGQAGPRFALASLPLDLGPEGEALLLPLATGPGLASGLGARNLALPPLRRDGLDSFSWQLFAEPALAGFHADELADQAEAMRLLGNKPLALRGLHAVFGTAVDGPVEEPTLLAIPDAVQPGWRRLRRRTPARQIHPQPPAPATEACAGFKDCALTPLPTPQFQPDADPDAAGNFMLRWTRSETGATYELQEAADLEFKVSSPAYTGADTRLAVTGKSRGTLVYRVRATLGARSSGWSDVVDVKIGGSLYEVREVGEWQAIDLLALHRLMLRAAAGRGDMLALLGLPEHYRWSDALSHAQALRSSVLSAEEAAAPNAATLPPALGVDESRALSHGTLTHPWVLTRRVDNLIACPPDGAIAGQLAASALARGAWIAVANRPLKDVVALGLAASTDERQALLEAQVNPLVASAAGFVAGSSETLLQDADWRPVNVRRLMCLLRRAALRRGATYVFEPNGPTLRRTVERAFEALLEELLRRGAFAGRSAAQAYRVEVGDEINTEARRDAGQFRVDLKVAPALPLTFLTVRLARSGERLAAQELR